MAGLAIFTATSLTCAPATGDTFLIIMRGIQGLGAAPVLPAALSIVMKYVRRRRRAQQGARHLGGIGAAAATVGVLADGTLTRHAGWPYIIFLSAPIGAARGHQRI